MIYIFKRFEGQKPTIENKIFGCEVVHHPSIKHNPEKVKTNPFFYIKKFPEYDGILAWHEDLFDKQFLSTLKNCKGIVRIGMGYDNVDLGYASSKGIVVSNVPDYGVEEVADSAICLMLNLMRKTHFLANKVQQGEYPGSNQMKGFIYISMHFKTCRCSKSIR